MKTVIFFDLETGGLDPKKHPIIQIAAAAADWESLEVIEKIEAKLRVDISQCELEALKMNSYDQTAWDAQAVDAHEALGEMQALCNRHACLAMVSKAGRSYKVAQLAAYNAPFDSEFLFAAFRQIGLFLPASFSVLCTLQRVRWHFAERGERLASNRLGDVCRELGVTLEGAHDAQADNLAQVEVLKAIRKAVLA